MTPTFLATMLQLQYLEIASGLMSSALNSSLEDSAQLPKSGKKLDAKWSAWTPLTTQG